MSTAENTNELLNLKGRIEKLSKEKDSAIARRDVLKQTYDQKIQDLKDAGVSTDNLDETLQELTNTRDELQQGIEKEVTDIENKLKELKGV
jgi:benzoyl-CoA reductase/2-hydroxyglutaryl-CoA dehydratase subunit BcrC/BadD/HgdB